MECLQKDANIKGTMSIARVTYKMGQKKWRPMQAGKRLNMPSQMFSLLRVCWVDSPDKRPSFDEIVDFLETEVQKQVYGVKEGMKSTRRMTAQNSVMLKRIIDMESKQIEEEKGKVTGEERRARGAKQSDEALRMPRRLASLVNIVLCASLRCSQLMSQH